MEPGLCVVMSELRNPLTIHYIQYKRQRQSRKEWKHQNISRSESARRVYELRPWLSRFSYADDVGGCFFNKIQLKLSFHPISPSAQSLTTKTQWVDWRLYREIISDQSRIKSMKFTKRKIHLVLRHFYSWSSCCAAVAWLWNVVCIHNEWLKFIFHHQRKQLTKRGNVTRSRRIVDERDEEKNYW